MSTLLESLIHKAARQPSDLQRHVASLGSRLTPALADEAIVWFKQAFNAFDGPRAFVGMQIAAALLKQLGRPTDALRVQLDWLQLQFMAANTVQEYEVVHESASNIAALFRRLSDVEHEFRAFVLAGDTAFFAASLSAGQQTQGWLQKATGDLLGALHLERSLRAGELWSQRLVSLTGAVIDKAASAYILEAPPSELFRELAEAIEARVPVQFAFPGDPKKTNAAACLFAEFAYDYGDPVAGKRRFEAAMHQGEAPNLWSRAARRLYRRERDRGGAGAGLDLLRDELRAKAEIDRARYRSRAGRLWAAHEHAAILGELVLDQASEGASDPSALFAAIEALKARLLLDQISIPRLEPGPELLADERRLLTLPTRVHPDLLAGEITLQSLLFESLGFGDDDKRDALASLEEKYHAAHRGLVDSGQVAPLTEVMAALAPSEALIEYFIPFHLTHPAKDLIVGLVTRESARFARISLEAIPSAGMIGRMSIDGEAPVDISPLGGTVARIRTHIQNGDDTGADENLAPLHELLIGTAKAMGLTAQEYSRWIVVPHGVLHYVPFAALLNEDGRRLIETVELVIAPSASVWLVQQRQDRPPASEFLGLANPAGAHLPGAERELAEIDAMLAGRMNRKSFVGQAATVQAMSSNIAGCGVLHIGAHGDYPETDAIDFHAFNLSPSTGGDGRLTAEAVRGLDLRSARLVTLGVCDGGLYRFGPADEPFGLFPAFLSAGAESILGTLWPIEDHSARLFMGAFYRRMLDQGPAAALRDACRRFIEQKVLLRSWCGFVLAGSGRPIQCGGVDRL